MASTTLKSASAPRESIAQQIERPRFFARLPRAAWIAALLATMLHLLPHLRASLDSPADWQPTGILSVSPDYMQYRVWMRQSLEEGPVVSNRFTTESNRPYLPVPFYYVAGLTAQLTSVAPEWIYVAFGAGLAFLLTLLIFACVRYFLKSGVPTWTAFLAILIGGGVGGYILYLRRSPWAWHIRPIQLLFIDPFRETTELIDRMRGEYVFSTLFDTHFLLIWLVCIAAVMSFYATVKSFSWLRVIGTAALFAAATVIHVYEGVTLTMIVAGIALLSWIKGVNRRAVLITAVVSIAAVGVVFVWIAWLVKASGLPIPEWRGIPLPPTLLFLGFPVAWVLLAWGLSRYWRNAGLEECFLLGWLLGCTLLALSAPFYPWPHRGVLSMQIPLTIVAAAIWFSRRPKLAWKPILIAVLLMGSTPVMQFYERWQSAGFDPSAPHKFAGPAHRAITGALRQRARTDDVLIAEAKDRLWLAPDYRGRHYAGHFFLTVDFSRKQAELVNFYNAAPQAQNDFIRNHNIRFVYVRQRQKPERFKAIPGLVPIRATPIGTLFEFAPAAD